jgi:predicted GNAT family N-acyltransferase
MTLCTVVHKMSLYTLLDMARWENIQASVLHITPDFFAQYTALMRELKPNISAMTAERLALLTQRESETLLVLTTSLGEIVGSAQASLMLPGGEPVAYIGNVVVKDTYRRKGLGAFLIEQLRVSVLWRYRHLPQEVTFELTSQEERETADFYKRLGFVATRTVRYSSLSHR